MTRSTDTKPCRGCGKTPCERADDVDPPLPDYDVESMPAAPCRDCKRVDCACTILVPGNEVIFWQSLSPDQALALLLVAPKVAGAAE